MTRIFGFEQQHHQEAHIPNGAQKVFDNLQEAVTKTYDRGWQAYGLGFIVVGTDRAQGFSVYRGYQGIKQDTSIKDLLPQELHSALAENPVAFFGVLQNGPDQGESNFDNEDKGREFPIQSENWLVITMGGWGNNGFSDERLPWYVQSRPSGSIVQYLETNPETINFDWIDEKRTPLIIAAKKDGSQVIVLDNYTGKNESGYRYVTDKSDGLIHYLGVRNSEGEQI